MPTNTPVPSPTFGPTETPPPTSTPIPPLLFPPLATVTPTARATLPPTAMPLSSLELPDLPAASPLPAAPAPASTPVPLLNFPSVFTLTPTPTPRPTNTPTPVPTLSFPSLVTVTPVPTPATPVYAVAPPGSAAGAPPSPTPRTQPAATALSCRGGLARASFVGDADGVTGSAEFTLGAGTLVNATVLGLRTGQAPLLSVPTTIGTETLGGPPADTLGLSVFEGRLAGQPAAGAAASVLADGVAVARASVQCADTGAMLPDDAGAAPAPGARLPWLVADRAPAPLLPLGLRAEWGASRDEEARRVQ